MPPKWRTTRHTPISPGLRWLAWLAWAGTSLFCSRTPGGDQRSPRQVGPFCPSLRRHRGRVVCAARNRVTNADVDSALAAWRGVSCGDPLACRSAAGHAVDRGESGKIGAAGRKIRRDRRQPHPLCRCREGPADRLRAWAWRPPASFPAHCVWPFRPWLPADRARPSGLGPFDPGKRSDGPVARAGRDHQALHRNAGAGKAVGGGPFPGWRRHVDPGRRTSQCNFRHRTTGALDASGVKDAPKI